MFPNLDVGEVCEVLLALESFLIVSPSGMVEFDASVVSLIV